MLIDFDRKGTAALQAFVLGPVSNAYREGQTLFAAATPLRDIAVNAAVAYSTAQPGTEDFERDLQLFKDLCALTRNP